MSTWRRRTAMTTSAIVVLALGGGVVALDRLDPVGATRTVAATPVEVAAAPVSLVCPGPVRLPASSGDAGFDPAPVGAVTSVRVATTGVSSDGAEPGTAASGLLTDLAGGASLARIAPSGPGSASAEVTSPTGPVLLTANPVDGRVPRTAGTSTSLVTAGDLRGLAVTACTEAGTDAWLVGGSTALSSTALLTLVNPGTTAASVDLEIWGPNGPAELSGGSALLVAPHAQRQLLLSGIAAEQRRIVVHVSATGGTVAASLQDDALRGLTPGGLTFVSAGSAPSTRQVVTGITVPSSAIDDTDQAVLRLVVPGSSDTTARISLLGPDGVVPLPGAESIDLAAGSVIDVPLAGIPAGSYTAVVQAQVPVLAAAMITRIGGTGQLENESVIDRAWVASGAVGSGGAAALPSAPGVTSTIVLAGVGRSTVDGGGDATGTLRAFGVDGSVLGDTSVTVPAGRTIEVPVADLGAGAVTVDLVPATDTTGTDAELAWAVVATANQSDGQLVAVLTPDSPAERRSLGPRQTGDDRRAALSWATSRARSPTVSAVRTGHSYQW